MKDASQENQDEKIPRVAFSSLLDMSVNLPTCPRRRMFFALAYPDKGERTLMTAMDDKENALVWLERAYEIHNSWIPRFDTTCSRSFAIRSPLCGTSESYLVKLTGAICHDSATVRVHCYGRIRSTLDHNSACAAVRIHRHGAEGNPESSHRQLPEGRSSLWQ